MMKTSVPTEKGEPMLTEDNHNLMELCFRNGEQHVKEKIIRQFKSLAESMACIPISPARISRNGTILTILCFV